MSLGRGCYFLLFWQMKTSMVGEDGTGGCPGKTSLPIFPQEFILHLMRGANHKATAICGELDP
jgi:hypothetical protein